MLSRWQIWLAIASLLIYGGLSTSPAQAQTETWSCFFDFTASAAGWTAAPRSWAGGGAVVESYSSGVGWISGVNAINPTYVSSYVDIYFNIPSGANITLMRVRYALGNPGGWGRGIIGSVLSYRNSNGSSTRSVLTEYDVYNTSGGTLTGVWSGSTGVMAYGINVNQWNAYHISNTVYSQSEIKNVELQGNGTLPSELSPYCEYDNVLPEYIKPLATPDEAEPIYDLNSAVSISISDMPFKPVHAAISGDVVSIISLNDFSCGALGIEDCISENTYIVSIADSEDVFVYVVYNALAYVDDETTLTAGCILGETRITTDVTGSVTVSKNGAAIASEMTLEPPSEAEPCDEVATENFICEEGGLFQDSWSTIGGHQWEYNSVILEPGATLYQIMSLPSNRRTRMVVYASQIGGEITYMEMQLGSTTSSVRISTIPQTHYMEFDYHQADVSDFYTVAVKNEGEENIRITEICVEIEVANALAQCFFENYSFSSGGDEWVASETIRFEDGEARMPDATAIYQDAHLFPADGGSQEYTISVDVGLWYYDFYTPNMEDDINTLAVTYTYPSGNTITIDTVTFGELASEENELTLSTTFTVSTETDDNFVFAVDLTNADANVRGAVIRRVCLRPVGTEEFPGYEDSIIDDGLPFAEMCEVLSPPQGNNIGKWVNWHWHNLSQFFECDLMVVLNDIYAGIRWLQATFILFFDWLEDVFLPWLEGWFTNFITDPVEALDALSGTSSTEAPSGVSSPQFNLGGDCEDYEFWCFGANAIGDLFEWGTDAIGSVWDAVVGLLSSIFELLALGVRTFLGIVEALYNIAKAVFEDIAEAIITVRDMVNELMTMWNDTEALPPPGLPDCTTSPETKDVCLIYWALESTILGGTYGELIIPVFASVIAIVMLIVFAGRYRDLVDDSTDNF